MPVAKAPGMKCVWATVDDNEACATIADRFNDAITIPAMLVGETQFQVTARQDPGQYRDLGARAQQQVEPRLTLLKRLAGRLRGHA